MSTLDQDEDVLLSDALGDDAAVAACSRRWIGDRITSLHHFLFVILVILYLVKRK